MRNLNLNSFSQSMAGLLMILVLLSCLPVTAFAQETPFVVVPLSGPDAMLLVVGGPTLHPGSAAANGGWSGYHLYRKGPGDADFIRITTAPLTRPGTLAELEQVMGGKIDGFERFAGLTTKQELWQRIEQNDSSVLALSLLSKNFRKALGLLYWDSKVERGKLYEYRATMVAADGRESAPSEPQQATFGVPPVPLLGPLEIKGKSGRNGVEITWRANPADSGALTYAVYRCPDSVGTYLRLNFAPLAYLPDTSGAAEQGSFVDTTAQTGRTYYYSVVSVDYAGNESPRRPQLLWQRADETPPPIPQNVFANPSDLGIVVTWDVVKDDNLAGYNIFRSLDADSHYVRLNTVILPADTGYYEDRATTLVDRFFYRVSAVDRAGNESEQSPRSLSLFENYLPPVAPQGVRVVSLPNSIRVQWEKSDEADLQGYYVFRADSYNGELSQVSPLLEPDSTSFIDTSAYLSGRGRYWYLVQAINFSGISSNYSLPAAASPQKEEATDAPTSFFGYHDAVGARLFWGAFDDNMLAGYNLYRAVDSDNPVWEKLTAAPLGREVGEYLDTTVVVGTNYLYQVRTINGDGVEGSWSHNVRIVAFEPAPLPPAGLRADREAGTIRLFWDKTLQPNVAGYRIYRRDELGSPTPLASDIVTVGVTEYRDQTVRPGGRYYYSLTCVNAKGVESDRSAEVSLVYE